jgi:hypothetical protein
MNNQASVISNDDRFAEHKADMLDALSRMRKVLKASMPDTFIGRRTFEPFPKEDQDS